MKKTITTTAIIIGYFILMSTLGIIAAVPGNVQQHAKEAVRNQIIRSITCPDFITENSPANRVKAIVKVDETGKVTVDEINSANPQLSQYVLNQLQGMQVKNTGEAEKFVLLVNFKVE